MPFLSLSPRVRRVLYSTTMIEALDGRIRNAVHRHGHFPDEAAAKKLQQHPDAADKAYERAVDAQLRALLATPDAPLFELVSRDRLTAAYARDPLLPGAMSIRPSATTPWRRGTHRC